MELRKLDLSNPINRRCERCKFFTRYSKSKSKLANPYGFCSRTSKQMKYWNVCSKFVWKDIYLGIRAELNVNSKYVCRRCGRPLTDKDSIIRGFGKECYEKHVRELIRQSKRLF